MTLVPIRPLPDELCLGHLGRIRAWHGYRNLNGAAQAVSEHVERSGLSTPGAPRAHALAALADISAQDYVEQHTMLPYMSFALASAEDRHCGGAPPNLVRKQAFMTPRAAAYFCPACIEHDLSTSGCGYAYWRRTHHLPARSTCPDHPDSTLVAVVDAMAFAESPAHWLGKDGCECLPLDSGPEQDPVVVRFHEMTQAMLGRKMGFTSTGVGRALGRMAAAAGLSTAKDRRQASGRKRFADLVSEGAPRSLLLGLFPTIAGRTYGTPFEALDVAVVPRRGAPASAATAMALTMFFDGPSSAFEFLESNPRQVQVSRVAPLTAQLLADQVKAHNGDLDAMADALQLDRGRLLEALRSKRSKVLPLILETPSIDAVSALRDRASLPLACTRAGDHAGIVGVVLALLLPDLGTGAAPTSSKRSSRIRTSQVAGDLLETDDEYPSAYALSL
jgi:hypothetical protein